jgi:hypothetical protein
MQVKPFILTYGLCQAVITHFSNTDITCKSSVVLPAMIIIIPLSLCADIVLMGVALVCNVIVGNKLVLNDSQL